eukprot:CAMPEP_0203777162 /NCGR_PEP_ID=MMETSP0099_2-20121227/7227_1 /ASSEMBLY_ACC=CAM_ASM_000209 /TAXON_ID=96639 /ORGANISM=" , Strain NY0313808BC1" /LENGTH=374 /DNA_ID=CAMNT_0050676407 /DNA_START=474 /DNA_END=1599 /DNA_ORIENTATION=+
MPLGELDLNRGEDRRRQRSRSFGSGNDSTSPTHVLTNGYDSDDIISPRKDENVDIYNRLDPAAKVNMGFKSRLFTPESVTKVLRNRVNRVKEIGHKNKEVVNTRNDGLTFKADLEEAKPPIDVSKMKGNKWLKIGNSIVKETSQKPWRDLVRWGAVIFLWVLAICYPELPMQTMTQGVSFAQTHFRTWTPDNKVEVPQAAEFKRPKNLVEEQKIDYSAAPYLGMVLPVEDVVAVETGDLSIRFEIKNVYPNKIAAHRGSKVCLRIAGDQSHTTLGCLDIQPTLDIVLRDLAPGKITLVATLLSQARKLATVSKGYTSQIGALVSPHYQALLKLSQLPQQRRSTIRRARMAHSAPQHVNALAQLYLSYRRSTNLP